MLAVVALVVVASDDVVVDVLLVWTGLVDVAVDAGAVVVVVDTGVVVVVVVVAGVVEVAVVFA